MTEEGNYQVQPAKPWHKTRLTAEEWFPQNPPHVWRTLEDAVGHYMASGFVLESRTSPWETELTGEGQADLRARSRYTSGASEVIPSFRWLLRTALPWTVLTFGAALLVLVPRWVHMVMGGEQYPRVLVQAIPDGSGVFLEERRKGDALFGRPMVHPETGQTGWDGCPEDYYRNVVEGWKRQLGG